MESRGPTHPTEMTAINMMEEQNFIQDEDPDMTEEDISDVEEEVEEEPLGTQGNDTARELASNHTNDPHENQHTMTKEGKEKDRKTESLSKKKRKRLYSTKDDTRSFVAGARTETYAPLNSIQV